MDYTLLIKQKFLNQSVDFFAQSFDKVDYKGFEKIVSHNTFLGSGKIAIKICRKNVKSVFDSVDGITINTSAGSFVRKDGFVDRDEMYQLIKNSYKKVYGKEITNDLLSKMTVRNAIDLIIKSYKKIESES